MSLQFTAGRFSAVATGTGLPLINGQLFTYVSTTTTPKPTYTDATLATPNTNPVILNARGEAQVWLGSGAYTFILKDSAGVTIWSVDGVIDGAVALSSQLADTTNPALGAGMEGFNPTLNYVADTVGAAIIDGMPSALSFVTSQADRAAIMAGTSTVDHTAILTAAIFYSCSVLLPEGMMNHTGLTLNKRGSGLIGKGARSVLKHTGSGTALTLADTTTTVFPGGALTYVNDGQFRLDNFTMYTNGPIGIDVSKTRSTGSTFTRLVMKPAAYFAARTSSTYVAGTVAISCDNNPWNGNVATYAASVRDCQISGYETMALLNEVVNLWEFDNVYTIDCLNYAKLSTNPGANPGVGKIRFNDGYCESGIAGARGIVFGAGGGTNVTIDNITFELTNAAATQYAYDFSAGGLWTGCAAHDCTYLLQGDGAAINARRIIGTAPIDFIETNRSYTSATYGSLAIDWTPGASTAKPRSLASPARFGGFQQGSGTIYLGRSDVDSADSVITQDSTGSLIVQAVNDVRLVSGLNSLALTFTPTPAAGATSATLSTNWTNPTGVYNVNFANDDVRAVTLTNGATTATWTTGLSAVAGLTTSARAFGLFNGKGWRMNGSSFGMEPTTDNTQAVGSASMRASVVYAGTGTINTSDAREKDIIGPLSDAEKLVAARLKSLVKAYRWKDAVESKADGARIHVGWIAQEVIAAFQAEGLDPFAYGVCCHDEWTDADGTPRDRFGLRLDDLLAFIVAAL